MSKHAKWMLILLVAGFVPVLRAEEPATTPANPPAQLREHMRRSDRFGRGFDVPPDPHEIADMETFMEENSPNRFSVLKKMLSGGPRPVISGMALRRYRSLRETQKEDAVLYEIKVKEIRAEDDVFGVMQQIRSTDSATTRPNFEAALREKILALVQIRFEERQHRIERMEKALEEAKAKLEADKAGIEGIVDRQAKAILEKAPPATRPAGDQALGVSPAAK